ncbi:MAG: hypothetical protein MJ172_06620 [Clostridia bacterium]|nr:hypothetical protein [Clostridia bacterium]
MKILVSVPFSNIKQQLSFHLNTEPNLPNSGDNTTPPGATNQSGSVGGNGYGNGDLYWGTWDDYEHVVVNGSDGPREYARIGDRLYTRHAVERIQPSGMRYSSTTDVEVSSSRIYSAVEVNMVEVFLLIILRMLSIMVIVPNVLLMVLQE